MAEGFGLQKKERVAMHQWSELQADVLELILKRLVVIDIIRFKAVCNSWNIAASSYVSSPLYKPIQTPWIMFHYNCNKEDQRSSSLTFFSHTENKPYKIKKDHKDDLILGSSHGWLLSFDVESKTLYLLNPFSSSTSEGKIQLPWMDFDLSYWKFFNSVVLSSDPSRSKNFTIAILNCYYRQRLSFWDYGDTIYRTSIILVDKVYEDMICHKGEMYAFSRNTRTVDIWDFHGVSPKRTFNIERIPETLHEQWKVPKENEDSVKRWIRLVQYSLSGEILCVEKVFFLEIIGFKVCKLNLSERRWMPLQSLSDQAILLDDDKAVSVSTRDFPEFEENSIYYADASDLRVYNLKEKKVTKSYPCENWKTAEDSSFWVVPTLSP